MTLDEAARLAGGFRWAESRLFEILGGWVQSTPEPDAKLALDRHSQHHAWRAQQWWDRLPVVADIDREALVVPASDAALFVVDSLAELDGSIPRLAGAYRIVIPRLAAAYERQAGETNPISDGSALRTLAIVTPDLASDWREGEFALQDLLTSQEAIDSAARATALLEAAFAPSQPI